MKLYFKKKIIYELLFEDGDFSCTFRDMEKHIDTNPTINYFSDDNFPYPKQRNGDIDSYLVSKGIAIPDDYGDLKIGPNLNSFVKEFYEHYDIAYKMKNK